MATPSGAAVPAMVPPFPVPPESVPGLSSCFEEKRILSDGVPVPVTSYDIDALRLVEHAVALRRSLLLCPPDPLGLLVALIPAAAHMASFIGGYREFGVAAGSRLRIAVVTTDYRIRGYYRGLSIRAQPGAPGAPLRSVVPAGVLGAGSVVHVLDECGRPWSTVFVGSVAGLDLVAPVDLVVADLPVPDPRRLADLKVPVVLVTRDPSDPTTLQFAGGIPSFGWEVTTAGPPGTLPTRMLNRAVGTIEVVPVVEPLVCENAELFWSDIGPLCRAARGGLGPEIAREAFALFHDLLGLALPLGVFEQSNVSSVAARVAALGRACRLVDGELRDLYLPMVEAELGALADAVRGNGAKPEVLLRVLSEALDRRQDVLLITRTAAIRRAYERHFSETGFSRVRVSSLGELATVAPADLAVLTGMAPTWARWVYRAGIARTLRVLAYGRGQPPGERFDEVEVVRQAVAQQRGSEALLAAPDRRSRSWRSLRSGEFVPAGPGSPLVQPLPQVTPPPPPPEAPPGLWDEGRWLSDLEPAASRQTEDGSDRLDRVVSGIRVDLVDGSWVVLSVDAPVSRWRPSSRRPDHVAASELCVGDELMFLDDDAHKTLMSKVLEVAELVPALAVAGGWTTRWRSALIGAYRAAGSYTTLARQLARLGCRVQAQTVRLWVIGVTLGPDDPEDVHRLGLLTSDQVLLAAHQEVSRAMRTMRSAHVRLGRRLADLTRHIGPPSGAGPQSGDELVDEVSGLTAADFESAVSVVPVQAVTAIGEVPAALTGRRQFRKDRSA